MNIIIFVQHNLTLVIVAFREARLTSEEAAFSQTYSSFDDLVSQFFSNLTSAEEELNELWQRLNISLDALNDLSLGLQNLTMTLGNDMRVQLEEATMLFQDIANLVRYPIVYVVKIIHLIS